MFFVSKFKVNNSAKPIFTSILSLINKAKNSEKPSQLRRLELDFDSDYTKAKELCRAWGKTATSFMTLNNQNHFFFDPEQNAYIAYRVHLKVAITVGDPVGPAEAVAPCIRQFNLMCQQRGWTPAFFAVEDNLNIYQNLGFKRLQVAEETYLKVAELSFKGKSNQDVRTALNRASREDIKFCRFEPGQAQAFSPVYMQMKQISNDWLQSKGLPELRFMLGSVDTVCDPEIRTYYAQDKHGAVQGYVSWLPCYSVEGWSLDLMRRSKDALPGIMEFLIARSALQFQLEGIKRIGLGAAPLAPIQNLHKPSRLEQVLYNKVRPILDRFYSFSNLFHFKRKFKPDWKPLYLVYPRNLALYRITLALLITYIKDGSKAREN